MDRPILVRGARQLLTLHGPSGPRRGNALNQVGLIEDGSLLIVNGTIASVGPTRRIENLAEAKNADELNASGRVVLPGWVDSHRVLTSLPLRLLDYPARDPDDARLTPSRVAEIAEQHIRTTSPTRLGSGAWNAMETATRHGTTSMEVKSGFGISEVLELKSLKISRAMQGCCGTVVQAYVAANPTREYTGRHEDYLNLICNEFLPKLYSRKLAEVAEISCDPPTFSLVHARRFLTAAQQLGFGTKIYSDEASLSGAAAICAEGLAKVICGLSRCERRDMETIARSSSIAALLPCKVLRGVHSSLAPARGLIDLGVPVALGTGVGSGLPSPADMQAAVGLACTHMHMTVEEAISAGTINGAYAIGRANVTGSLEFGKEADLIMLNVSDYREIPYNIGRNLVEMVMYKGSVIYREGTVACAR